MLRSTKTTHISVIVLMALCTMSGGFEKGRSASPCSNTSLRGIKMLDYQAIEPCRDFRISKNERVLEIKCITV